MRGLAQGRDARGWTLADTVLSYKGFDITIDYKDADHADLKIADRTFAVTRHEGALPAWMCDEAYFSHPEIEQVARHLVDYWYIVTDDESRPPTRSHEHGGEEKEKPKKRSGGGRRRSSGGSSHGGHGG